MDLYCPKCGEPWDFDSLHDEAQARYAIPYYVEGTKNKNPAYDEDAYQAIYRQVSAKFRTNGCEALSTAFDISHGSPDPDDAERDRTYGLTRAEAASALYDILGDDMDGAAAMLDDMSF